MGKSQVKLALEILLGDLKILQGHVRALVAEKFDDRGKADAGAQHLSSICVSKLVRDDADGNADGSCDVSQGGAQSANQHVTAASLRQEETTGLGRGGWAQRTDAFDQLTDSRIHRHPAFGFEFAQRYVDGPLPGADRAQAIAAEIDTFANAQTGVPHKQQGIAEQVIAAQ
jgi:hypothetical protein